MKHLLALASVACAFAVTSASAEFKFPTEDIPKSDAEYLAKVSTAAPPAVLKGATIINRQANDRVLQAGSNGWTCFIGGDGTPECDDSDAMEWRKAMSAKQTPPNKIGFIFMLAGDTGTSNHDGSKRSTHEHWVQTGPHVMLVGGAVKEMVSAYPRDVDVKDNTMPYVMFPGEGNEHVMIPVHMEAVHKQ